MGATGERHVQFRRTGRIVGRWFVGHELLWFHAAIFTLAAVVSMLADLYRTPATLEMTDPFLPWGIALSLHAIFVLAMRAVDEIAKVARGASAPRGTVRPATRRRVTPAISVTPRLTAPSSAVTAHAVPSRAVAAIENAPSQRLTLGPSRFRPPVTTLADLRMTNHARRLTAVNQVTPQLTRVWMSMLRWANRVGRHGQGVVQRLLAARSRQAALSARRTSMPRPRTPRPRDQGPGTATAPRRHAAALDDRPPRAAGDETTLATPATASWHTRRPWTGDGHRDDSRNGQDEVVESRPAVTPEPDNSRAGFGEDREVRADSALRGDIEWTWLEAAAANWVARRDSPAKVAGRNTRTAGTRDRGDQTEDGLVVN